MEQNQWKFIYITIQNGNQHSNCVKFPIESEHNVNLRVIQNTKFWFASVSGLIPSARMEYSR
jgi:hypothetical protein